MKCKCCIICAYIRNIPKATKEGYLQRTGAMATARIHWTLICMHLLLQGRKVQFSSLPHCYFFSLNLLHIRVGSYIYPYIYSHLRHVKRIYKTMENRKKKKRKLHSANVWARVKQNQHAIVHYFFHICANGQTVKMKTKKKTHT